MSPLDQAASEMALDFKSRVLNYKGDNNLTIEQLAEECELSAGALNVFFENRRAQSLPTILKISLATGVDL